MRPPGLIVPCPDAAITVHTDIRRTGEHEESLVRIDPLKSLSRRSCHVKTEQIVNSPDHHNVTIVIDGLEIPDGETPKPPIGEGDLDVGVDGWTVIIIDINTEN